MHEEKWYEIELKDGTKYDFWFIDYSGKFEQMLKDYNVKYEVKNDNNWKCIYKQIQKIW